MEGLWRGIPNYNPGHGKGHVFCCSRRKDGGPLPRWSWKNRSVVTPGLAFSAGRVLCWRCCSVSWLRRAPGVLLGLYRPDERRPSYPVCASKETQLYPDPRPAAVRAGVCPVPGSPAERFLLRRTQSQRRHSVAVPHQAATSAARLRSSSDEERAKDGAPGVQAAGGHRSQQAGGGGGGAAGDPRPHRRGGEDRVPAGSSAAREGNERKGDPSPSMCTEHSESIRAAVQSWSASRQWQRAGPSVEAAEPGEPSELAPVEQPQPQRLAAS